MTEERIVWSVIIGCGLLAIGALLLEANKIEDLQSAAERQKWATQADKTQDAIHLQTCNQDLALTRRMLIQRSEIAFERARDIRTGFHDCKFIDESYVCSGSDRFDDPVRFHCDLEGCQIDCGGGK